MGGNRKGGSDSVAAECGSGSAPVTAAHCPTKALRPRLKDVCFEGSEKEHCKSLNKVLYRASTQYPAWYLRLPNFVRPEHGEIFLALASVRQLLTAHYGSHCPEQKCGLVSASHAHSALFFWQPPYTTGLKLILQDGTFREARDLDEEEKLYSCRRTTSYKDMIQPVAKSSAIPFEKLAFFIRPEAEISSLRQFLSTLMPGIVQVWDIIEPDKQWLIITSAHLLEMSSYRSDNSTLEGGGSLMKDIWKMLFKERPVIALKKGNTLPSVYKGRATLFPCYVPDFHPFLWQKMREMFEVDEKPLAERFKIIFLENHSAYDGSEQQQQSIEITNKEEMLEEIHTYLKRETEAGHELVTLDAHKFIAEKNLEDVKKLFSKQVKAIIGINRYSDKGPLSSGFELMTFCPSNTVIIEILPVAKTSVTSFQETDGRDIRDVWWKAISLQHHYYMIPVIGGRRIQVRSQDIISILRSYL